MSTVGQIEKKTQARVVALFRDRLGYDYLGHWIDRAGNANIEPDLLTRLAAKAGRERRASSTARCMRWARRPATPARASTTATAPSTTCCATA